MRGGSPIVTCSRSIETVGKTDAPIPPIVTGWPMAFDACAAIAVRTASVARMDRAQTTAPIASSTKAATTAATTFLTIGGLRRCARTAQGRAVLEHRERVHR